MTTQTDTFKLSNQTWQRGSLKVSLKQRSCPKFRIETRRSLFLAKKENTAGIAGNKLSVGARFNSKSWHKKYCQPTCLTFSARSFHVATQIRASTTWLLCNRTIARNEIEIRRPYLLGNEFLVRQVLRAAASVTIPSIYLGFLCTPPT